VWRNRYVVYVLIVVAVAILVGVIFGLARGLEWYDQRWGDSPHRAVREYFQAMADADYDRMYDMTSVRELTDVFNRKMSRSDFTAQVRQVTGNKPLTIHDLEATKVGSHGDSVYYKVILDIEVGATRKVVDFLVEVIYQNTQWTVAYPFTPTL
jgi:hypothetical protein